MTSGQRTPENIQRSISRFVRQKDADGKRLLSYEEVAERLRIDRRIVWHEVWLAACHWWEATDWKDDPLDRA
jgi:hypothetical protein